MSELDHTANAPPHDTAAHCTHCLCGERLDDLIDDILQVCDEIHVRRTLDGTYERRLVEASHAVSAAHDWAAEAHRKTHDELQAARAALTAHRPDTRPTDKAALERWVQTGRA